MSNFKKLETLQLKIKYEIRIGTLTRLCLGKEKEPYVSLSLDFYLLGSGFDSL